MTEELKQVGDEAQAVADAEGMEGAAASTVQGSAGADSVLGQATRLITPPAAGETEVIRLSPGERFELATNPASVNLTIDGNNLVLGFDLDGDRTADSFVVLEDMVLAVGGENPPVLMVAGEAIGVDLLVGNALALSGPQSGGPGTTLETAAGDAGGAQGGGATEYSDNLGDVLNLLIAQGVIPPVELEFGLIELEDEIHVVEEDVAPPEAPPVVLIHDETPGVQNANDDGVDDEDDVPSPLPVPLNIIHAILCEGGYNPELPPNLDTLQAMGTIPFGAGETIALNPVVDGSDSGLDTGGTGSPRDVLLFNADSNLIVGVSFDGEEAEVVFFVYLDEATGEIWFVQCEEINHFDTADHDEADTPRLLNLLYTITGAGGSTVGSLQIQIQIQDDGPTAAIDGGEGSVLIDETAGLQGDDTVAPAVVALFTGVSNAGSDGDFPQYAASGSPVVVTSFSFGTDNEGGTTALSLAIVGGDGTGSGLTTTDGKAISLFLEGGLIVGRYDSDGDLDIDGNDAAAFAIALQPDGTVAVAQYVSLTHPDSPNEFDESVDLAGLVNAVVTVTDGDGDVDTDQIDIGRQINFDDDGPNPPLIIPLGFIAIDETADLQKNDTIDPDVVDLFGDVDNPGSGGVDFPQYAVSGGPLVLSFGQPGADDEGATTVLSLAIVSGDGTPSGLSTTDGDPISLFLEGGLIVGRYDSNGDASIDNADDAAFAISLQPDGTVAVAQYVSLFHNDPNSHDDLLSLSGKVNAVMTITDGDGDVVANEIGIGQGIFFFDDGPDANDDDDTAEVGGPAVSGNVIDGTEVNPGDDAGGDPDASEVDSAGSDGPGVIRSITHDGNVYTLNATGDGIDIPPANFVSFAGGVLTIETAEGGTFAITITGSNIGDYTYTPPVSASSSSEAFDYVLEDGDGDADSATLTINLDDAPTAQNSAVIVDEDGLLAGNGDSADGDDVVPNTDGDNDESTSTGSLVYDAGANGFQSLSLDVVDGADVTISGSATQVTSGGVGLVWNVVSATVIEAVTNDVNETPIIRITLSNVDGTGADYDVELLGQVDHPVTDNPVTGPTETAFEDNILIDIGYTVTDNDNDSDSAVLTINIDDDVPDASIALYGGSVTIDETAGEQDNDTTVPAVVALFAGVSNAGSDGADFPQFAVSGLPVVDISSSLVGADDAGATTVLSLAIVGGNGTPSGLATTDGDAISLFLEGGLIVGRYDSDGDLDIDGDDAAAFAIALQPDGTVAVAQYVSLTHPDSPNEFDESVDLAGLVNAVVTVTDGDGDVDTDIVAIGSQIKFEDDGPTANDDFDKVQAGASTTGNVITGADDNDPDGNPDLSEADSAGADNEGFAVVGVVDGDTGSNLVAPGSLGVAIVGANGTLVLHADGSYTYTADPNPVSDSDIFTYTVRDGDGDLTHATLTITLDAAPTANNSAVIVDEDGLPAGNGDGADGDDMVPNDDGDNNESTSSGSLVYDAGANGFQSLSLDASNGDPVLISGPATQVTSGGVGLVWQVISDEEIWAVTDDLSGTPIIKVILSNVTATGADYDVLLVGPIDHPATDNPATVAVETAFEGNALIDIGYTVRDGDGDPASAVLTINVDDDVPVQETGTANGTVYENELATPHSTGSDQAGITGDNDNFDPNNDDTVVSGNVSSLVDFGADGSGDFSLISDTSDLESQGLTSKGDSISYSVVGNTLTATANGGGDPRTVFTLTLTTAGAYVFTLYDQLDHLPGNGMNTLEIDFSSVISATDGDADSITLTSNSVVVTVVDDVPSIGAPDHGVVANAQGTAVTGDLDLIIGADELGVGSLFGNNGPSDQTSGGQPVIYFVDPTDPSLLIAHTGGDPADESNQVFTLQLNGAGTYTFTLLKPLDATETVEIGASSAFGSGPTAFRILSEAEGTEGLAIISGVGSGGGGINGSTAGWGVDNNLFGTGETIRLDFGAKELGSPGPGEFSGPLVSGANLALLDYKDGDEIEYEVFFVDANGAASGGFMDTVTVTGNGNIDTFFNVTAPEGLFLGHIDFEVIGASGSGGRLDLVDVEIISNTGTLDLLFDVDVTDHDGDSASGVIDITVDGSTDVLSGTSGNDAIAGDAAGQTIEGLAGDDVINDGAGNDIIIGGGGADLINLANDGETDILVYNALPEAGDTVTGFDISAPNIGGNGGDIIDLSALLDTGTFGGATLANAIAGGFVELEEVGGNTEVRVDLNGGSDNFTTIVTVNSVTVADLSDNIVVD